MIARYVPELGSLLWQPSALDKDLSTPPGSPSIGNRYIVGLIPTGDWSGHSREITTWNGTAWIFTTPEKGMKVYVEDEERWYIFSRYGSDSPSWWLEEGVSYLNGLRARESTKRSNDSPFIPDEKRLAHFCDLHKITGITVEVEASITGRGDPILWTATVAVDLSWDGGSSYTAQKTFAMDNENLDFVLDSNFTLGGSSDLWGRSGWLSSECSDANFRARLTLTARNASTTLARVDLIRVKIRYSNDSGSSSGDTGFKAPITTGSPLNQWTNGANVEVSDDARATESTVGDKLDTSVYGFTFAGGGVSAGLTINLPDLYSIPNEWIGRMVFFKKQGSSLEPLTIVPFYGQKIDGSSSNIVLTASNDVLMLMSDGIGWLILHKTGGA